MLTFAWKSCIGVMVLATALFVGQQPGKQTPSRTVLLEVVRNSWEFSETRRWCTCACIPTGLQRLIR